MKAIIVGSRSLDTEKHKWYITNYLDRFSSKIDLVICGGAKGPDLFGAEWAKSRNISIQYFYPDWDKHGKGAGMIRNLQMIAAGDTLIAFWDGVSKGTKHSIDSALKEGLKTVLVVNFKNVYL